MEISDPLVSTAVRISILLGVFIVALFFESRRPLRKVTQSKPRRVFINLSLGAISVFTLRFTFYPVVFAIAVFAEGNQLGLLHQIPLSAPFKIILSFIL